MSLPLADLPPAERPRERLLALGSAALADAELLAILLRTGRVGASALEVAHELLAERGGLVGLLDLDAPALNREGLGPAKVTSLLAAIEIGRRLGRSLVLDRGPLRRPDQAARYLFLRYASGGHEVMGALFLDARGHLLGEREFFRGTLNRLAVEPREILRECLQRGAAGVILFHTHPSGNPAPSGEDQMFTRRMAEAADLVGVRLVDHLVLGAEGTWSSLGEKGAW